ncbi:MAG: exodeoxyribonuclease III [Porticoccaceae bacterium]
MRIISASVDGIHQAGHRGLFGWLAAQDAEVICLQDLRARAFEIEDRPEFQLPGFFSYLFDSPNPHSNGVAIYVRTPPKAIMFGFGLPSGEDMDGRYLQADYEQLSIVSVLAPPGSGDPHLQEVKNRFFLGLQNHLHKVTRKRRRYILCGNWQTAQALGDVQNAAQYTGESGFLPEERQWFTQMYRDIGYADAFRAGNDDSDEFSWWPSGVIGEGDGWRTDTQIISKDLVRSVEYAVMYKAQAFSSHRPVIVDYDLPDL